MKAYVLFEEDMSNPEAEGLQQYIQQAPAILKQYGGTLLTAGGTLQTLEGDWHPKLLVIIEFDSLEQAGRWYYSQEYTPLIPLRRQASNSRVIVVEGTHGIKWPPLPA
jgi:uncharacterized protein (DUF1330 family)